MAKVRIGTIVETEYGLGPVVAITKQWIIHEDGDGGEVCAYIPDTPISIPAKIDGVHIDESASVEI